ncbi:MAG: DsrE/DsrF/DrsH-like family protein [Desulfobacterales bacterium]|jgi:peroxiredoxin family protein
MDPTLAELEKKIENLQLQVDDLKANAPRDQMSLVVFSGELDRVLAAFILAVGAAAMYERVVMFFTFWGIAALRDKKKKVRKQKLMPKMFDKMLPAGAGELPVSKMNLFGIGAAMIKSVMKEKKVLSLEELIKTAADFGVEIVICEMSMNLMGFSMDEMIDYPNVSLAGAAKYLQEAAESKVSLFL